MDVALENLVHALSRLPGLGKRSAERAALALVRRQETLLDGLTTALKEARDTICICSQCGAFTNYEHDPCPICVDVRRDQTILCVVEEPSDIHHIEAAGVFRGRYHALMGKLSPGKQTGRSELRIDELVRRVELEDIHEVLFALSTDMEGDATAAYLTDLLKGHSTKISRLAYGLPAGSGVAYSDPLTLKRAFQGRRYADE